MDCLQSLFRHAIDRYIHIVVLLPSGSSFLCPQPSRPTRPEEHSVGSMQLASDQARQLIAISR
jgi:hypothetical protein